MMTKCPPVARKDRLIHERVHDPYRSRRKPPEPSLCPVCKAVFKDGRWQWLESWPTDSHQEICQACQRVRDNYPAGLLTLSGDFVTTHRPELLGLVRNREQAERAQHPLHRIIKIEERPAEVVVTTTDVHLPKCIGEAVHRAHKGRLHLHYEKEGCFVRAHWASSP
jgi:hypothetical protein